MSLTEREIREAIQNWTEDQLRRRIITVTIQIANMRREARRNGGVITVHEDSAFLDDGILEQP